MKQLTQDLRMHDIIRQLKWRYAVKKYDRDKKISREDLNVLKEAVRLSPSSIGLQAYTILHIQRKEIREKLKSFSNNQSQITDASDLFVFCVKTKIQDDYIDLLIETMAEKRLQKISDLGNYKNSISTYVGKLSTEELINWNTKQSYISLGFLLESCALMHIDATPIEGFSKKDYDEVLGLSQRNLTSVVVCALGYRSEEDKYQYLAKSRKSADVLFETI